MAHSFDCLIIGAGVAGAVSARVLADAGKRVQIWERRNTLGGNAYDAPDASGILVHRYGPHIFHTDNAQVFSFLSRFTLWRDYQHRVAADVYGTKMPVPFNLTSLELAFGKATAAALEQRLIAAFGAERKVSILELRQNEDPALSALADYIYENIFLHYTVKQWGQTPEEIDPATTARVPIFLSRDDRYFQDRYQGIPADGYTALFHSMLDHPNIVVELNTEAAARLAFGDTLQVDGTAFTGPVIYTGALDELFGCTYGRLPYRTLDFLFETHRQAWYQAYATVNYTVSEPWTRITEFKHLTGQHNPNCTTIAKEIARPYTGAAGETPYYPILSPESSARYARYRSLAARWPNLYPLGRLADYRYYNMDAIAALALALADRLRADGA
ncbi:MAG: UDP-galactopyranose mutase [Oscillospiraceae bacterium]|nr:UDP-galactopyranose mutase [Oscillospiraceae bacterium]